MAIRTSDQISIVDITDAYSVILTSESYTFPGTTSAAKAGSCTTQIIAMRGSETIPATVDTSAITKPTGITVAKNTDATSPTLTITASTSFTTAGVVKIPVTLENGAITVNKEFSVAIAFTGATGAKGDKGATGDKGVSVTGITNTYQSGTSNTTAPTGTWSSTLPSVAAGSYLWTKMVLSYSDNTTSDPIYSVAKQGATGATGAKGDTGATGNGVRSTTITYQAGSSNTTAPTGTWVTTPPSVSQGQYLWTKMVVNYTNGSSSDPVYSVAPQGNNGSDAITMSITSSAGTIFKNSDIVTTLTAHVYKAGVELTSTQISALGTIKWYKDGDTTVVATGQNLIISAGDVTNKASYIAQLDD